MHNEYKINFWKVIFVNILSISRQMTPLDIVLLKKLVEFEIILYLFEKQNIQTN